MGATDRRPGASEASPRRCWCELSDEQATAILDRRARALARPLGRVGAGPGKSLVSFTRGARYALPVASIREVRPYVPPLPLPRAPSFVAGLVAARGGVVPAVDLGTLFGAPAAGDATVLIVVADGALEVALLADAVDAVADVPRAALGRLPAGTPALAREYGIGLAPGAGVVLDVAQLLHGIASALRSRDAGERRPTTVTSEEGSDA
jgi:chemotaxis signal transduction protein